MLWRSILPLHPTKYANLLGKLIDDHDVDVYLVNTGWTVENMVLDVVSATLYTLYGRSSYFWQTKTSYIY